MSKEIKVRRINPEIVEDLTTELLPEYSNVNKAHIKGFFQVYNSFVDPHTKVGRNYDEKGSTIESAALNYVIANAKENNDIQVILMAGLFTGKAIPFFQVVPSLGILMQYAERKVEPDSEFCKEFPFSEKEFGASISLEGDLSDSDIQFNVTDTRLEEITSKIVRELKLEIGVQAREEGE